MNDSVKQAIKEVKDVFPSCSARQDGDGGAYVIVEDVHLSDTYNQDSTWIGFHILRSYPYAPIYPHYVRNDLSRKDNQSIGSAAHPSQPFEERQAILISRRSRSHDPATDTALLKLQKVIEWLNNPT